MFSKTSNGNRGAGGLPSIVSKETTITGNIASPGAIQIEGTVIGDVECHDLTLGESGEVRGQVKCEVAAIHGSVNGELQVGTVTVAASAKISGDIVHETIAIESHARVEGQLIRRDATQQAKLNLVSDETA